MKEAVQLLGTLYKGDTTLNAPSFLTEKVLNGQQAHLCMLLKTSRPPQRSAIQIANWCSSEHKLCISGTIMFASLPLCASRIVNFGVICKAKSLLLSAWIRCLYHINL